MDGRVHGVAKSRTRLSDFFTFTSDQGLGNQGTEQMRLTSVWGTCAPRPPAPQTCSSCSVISLPLAQPPGCSPSPLSVQKEGESASRSVVSDSL